MTRAGAGSDYTGMDVAQLHHRNVTQLHHLNVTRIQQSHRGVRDNYLSVDVAQLADTYGGEAACLENAETWCFAPCFVPQGVLGFQQSHRGVRDNYMIVDIAQHSHGHVMRVQHSHRGVRDTFMSVYIAQLHHLHVMRVQQSYCRACDKYTDMAAHRFCSGGIGSH